MIHKKKVLAIIPARGGSKGLPRKNILDLGGLPLIAWTIRAAQNSKYIDKVILTSDDAEICSIAEQYQCDVPFIRPKELASDTATTASVVLHALEQLDEAFELIVLLQPTSPFRTEQHIDEAIEYYEEHHSQSLVSVSSLTKSPEWLFNLDSNNKLMPLLAHFQTVTRRQDAQKAYYLNGSIYLFNKEQFMNHPCFIDENTEAYFMDEYSSIDIDSINDLNFARFLLNEHLKTKPLTGY